MRIGAGPLRGVEGVLVSQKRNSRLVVSVTLLQRAVAVEIEADWARPIQSQPPGRPAEPVLRDNGKFELPGKRIIVSGDAGFLVGSTPS